MAEAAQRREGQERPERIARGPARQSEEQRHDRRAEQDEGRRGHHEQEVLHHVRAQEEAREGVERRSDRDPESGEAGEESGEPPGLQMRARGAAGPAASRARRAAPIRTSAARAPGLRDQDCSAAASGEGSAAASARRRWSRAKLRRPRAAPARPSPGPGPGPWERRTRGRPRGPWSRPGSGCCRRRACCHPPAGPGG